MGVYNESDDLGVNSSAPSFDAKMNSPLIKDGGPLDKLDKRYAVNWTDHTETDGQYIWSETKKWIQKEKDGWRHAKEKYKVLDWAQAVLPMVGWLRTYNIRQYLLPDFLAGLSVAALVIPQGMSYAKIAGLPSVYGLYGAFVPVLCYAALGTSRHLAVGPVAVTSLLLGNGLGDTIDAPIQANPNNPVNQLAQDEYNHSAVQVAFVAGVMYTLVGIFNLGWITNFISHTVISGFMSGAAVIIGLSQVKSLFGYQSRPNPANTALLKLPSISFPRHDPVYKQLGDLFGSTWTPYFAWRELIMGLAWIAILLIMKHVGNLHRRLIYVRAFGPLTVTVLSIAICNIFHLYRAPANLKVVGTIPKGLPGQTISWWFPMEHFGQKFKLAIIVCLIDVLESISIAKALAYKHKYELVPTQELRGLGLANLMGACFNCYTTTGSFSRSSVMDMVGSRTQLAGVISGLLVMITLLCLTPVFKNMPNNAQGAIIISAVIGLFNYTEWLFLWKVNKLDWIVFNAALFGVMFAGVEIGLAIAIGTSLLVAILKVAFPRTSILGHLPGTNVYRNRKMYPEAQELEGILMLRIDAPLFFANVESVKSAIRKYENAYEKRGRTFEFVILDFSPVTDVDASAIHFLQDWIQGHMKSGVQPVIANPCRTVVRQLNSARFQDIIGSQFIVVRMADAVRLCQDILLEKGKTAGVPGKLLSSNSTASSKE